VRVIRPRADAEQTGAAEKQPTMSGSRGDLRGEARRCDLCRRDFVDLIRCRMPSPRTQVSYGVSRANREAVDVGPHHRVKRLVDPAARLEDAREERALVDLKPHHPRGLFLPRHSLCRVRPEPVADGCISQYLCSKGTCSFFALVRRGARHPAGCMRDELRDASL
jgi:hypothetical protein